jgi:hypothetical protein
MKKVHFKWKNVIALAICFAVTTLAAASAQSAFFPNKEGLVQVYANKDGKGKTTSYTRQTIREVEGSGSSFTVSYIAETLDKNMKPLKTPVEIPYTITIRDGVMILDMKTMLGQLAETGSNEPSGMAVEIPSDLQPGQALKDAEMKLSIGFIKVEAIVTEGQCLVIEDVTVPAGTFKCHKITQTVNSKAMGIKSAVKTLTWYAPGIGVVKSETYDLKKDKLQSSQELYSMEN